MMIPHLSTLTCMLLGILLDGSLKLTVTAVAQPQAQQFGTFNEMVKDDTAQEHSHVICGELNFEYSKIKSLPLDKYSVEDWGSKPYACSAGAEKYFQVFFIAPPNEWLFYTEVRNGKRTACTGIDAIGVTITIAGPPQVMSCHFSKF